MLNLDNTQENILSITKGDIVLMTVYGETKAYIPMKAVDDSWDMYCNQNCTYGLSCENIDELKAMLLADYATGIITNVVFK